MKKSLKKILSGTASLAMLGSAQAAVAQSVTVESAEQKTYDAVANVRGEFSFSQDVLTPGDEVFSLFGTAATAMCAKPAFAMADTDVAENYYVNVCGRLKKSASYTLAELKQRGGTQRVMVCSCATGSAMAQAKVTGVPVSDLLELSELTDDANAVSFKSMDGYTATLPLNYVLENKAMLVWSVGGVDNPAGLQVWMPSTVAKYFTRQVAEVEVLHLSEVPAVEGAAAAQQVKVSIQNHMDDVYAVGDTLVFSGYADDCGTAIAALEFSMDGGATWTTCATENARADRWVAWNFGYTAEAPGSYRLDVRARTADGGVSPLASSVAFRVEAPGTHA